MPLFALFGILFAATGCVNYYNASRALGAAKDDNRRHKFRTDDILKNDKKFLKKLRKKSGAIEKEE